MERTERIFIGIDFAKEKFDACYLDEDGVVAHAVFQNVRKDYRRLLSWVRKMAVTRGRPAPEEVLFCGEHTGECSLPLSEWLVDNGYRIWLDNPVRIKRSAGIVRGKSDKADALMIAQYAMEKYKPGNSKLFVPDTKAIKELKSLYNCRMEIVKTRVGIGNRICSGSFTHSTLAEKKLAQLHRELTNQEDILEAEMEKLMTSTPELAANYRILVSFKGIGVLTAAVFIIYTNNFTSFSTPRQFACHVGVAPFGKDSGKSIHADPHVSFFANKKGKAALVHAANTAIRFNPIIREYAKRLKNKGKHNGVIMNNVKNKIIHIVFKMIQSQKEWQADYQHSHMSGNRNWKPLGVKEGVAEANPSADLSVQSSPSAFGGMQIYKNHKTNNKLLKKISQKICTET